MTYDFRPRVGETVAEMCVRLQSYTVEIGGSVLRRDGPKEGFPHRVSMIVPVSEDGDAYTISGVRFELLKDDRFSQHLEFGGCAPVQDDHGRWIPGDPELAAAVAVLRRDDYGQDEADGAACRAMANALRAGHGK